MKNAAYYKNCWLMPNSEAYTLFNSNKPEDRKKLDKHMKELDAKNRELQQRYGGR